MKDLSALFRERARMLILAFFVVGLLACSPTESGPGMIVTFVGTVKGVGIDIKSARLPSGRDFPTAGYFGFSEDPLSGGKTMGAAPDGRTLPEWVEFEWIEPPYPEPEQKAGQSYQEWRDEVHSIYRHLPLKKQRVFVKARIPKDVVEEVMEAKRESERGRLPEKHLDVFFIWTEQGIKFYWRIWQIAKDGEQTFPRSGGENIPVYRP